MTPSGFISFNALATTCRQATPRARARFSRIRPLTPSSNTGAAAARLVQQYAIQSSAVGAPGSGLLRRQRWVF